MPYDPYTDAASSTWSSLPSTVHVNPSTTSQSRPSSLGLSSSDLTPLFATSVLEFYRPTSSLSLDAQIPCLETPPTPIRTSPFAQSKMPFNTYNSSLVRSPSSITSHAHTSFPPMPSPITIPPLAPYTSSIREVASKTHEDVQMLRRLRIRM